MECPNCHSGNPPDAKFCGECGHRFDLTCSECGTNNPAGNKFCNECGANLKPAKEVPDEVAETKSPPAFPSKETIVTDSSPIAGERKHVTVLFSDLTGYTTMSEKLDPEEVKGITSRIFSEISKIVAKYDGFIEKYAGDAVMAIFGVPNAHEDDPIRAVKAAREIHECVDVICPEVESSIGQPISMHTGINTGLVVTGEVDMERGTHGVAGDTINVASRLSGLAEAGQILVDEDTFYQAEGHFTFESLDPVKIKGKAEPINIHKFLTSREKPVTVRRLSGLRADLVGRMAELSELHEAVENLREGKGRIFSICGGAGTGKSRLIDEFKATIDLDEIQWLEGHAYAHTQNMPYFPLIDLLNRIFHIEESDSPTNIREKIESGVESLIGKNDGLVPYVGGLYSLSYTEVEEVSPEFWKSRLQEATLEILAALAKRSPTVFFLEDLHWADPSFAKLLRHACLEIKQPAIVLCAYRPTFSLFTGHQLSAVGKYYHEIQLQDLSRSEAQAMLESLLKTESIPSDLKRYVQNKAEGNPFYLEELVNSLIESETLIRDNGHWRITKSISEAEVSSSVQGLISGRLDRLDKEAKRILQEASVIGRAFLYEILIKITELKDYIDAGLSTLERIDMIRIRAFQPDLEYMFKHPLTQEVVYNNILKKKRQEIHEQIALVMERLFEGRLSEFYETLAYHFALGSSVNKAVEYLVKAGEKSLAKYAVEEAHEYYQKAYDFLASKKEISEAEKITLIDILNNWGYVYYYLGEIKEWIELLKSHQAQADSLEDNARVGMFYIWFGVAHFKAGKTKNCYNYLCKCLEIGEKAGNQKVVGYACTWLTWACAEMGNFAEGIKFGKRAQKIAELFPLDQYIFFKSLGALCWINYFKGDTKKVFEAAERLLEYGEKNANSRSKVFGHWMKAFGYISVGDLKSSQKSCEKAMEVALDPAYPEFARISLGIAHFFGGQLKVAKQVLKTNIDFAEKRGMGEATLISQCFLAPILIAEGHMKQGTALLEKVRKNLITNQRRVWYAVSELILGEVNLQIATGPKPSLATMAKNIGFLVKNVPFASKKSEEHFNKAIELLKEIGAKGFLGPVYLSLGLLNKASKRNEQARQYIMKAINVFQECDALIYLEQAKEELASVE